MIHDGRSLFAHQMYAKIGSWNIESFKATNRWIQSIASFTLCLKPQNDNVQNVSILLVPDHEDANKDTFAPNAVNTFYDNWEESTTATRIHSTFPSKTARNAISYYHDSRKQQQWRHQ